MQPLFPSVVSRSALVILVEGADKVIAQSRPRGAPLNTADVKVWPRVAALSCLQPLWLAA